MNQTQEITTLSSISLLGMVIRKFSLLITSTFAAFLVGEQLALRDLVIYVVIWLWAIFTSKFHTGISSAILGFVILGSFGYSLYFGETLISTINPWTNRPYSVGTVFAVSLLMIQGGISAVEFVSELHDFISSFKDSGIVHEALLKPKEVFNYPTSISFRNVFS